MVIRAARGLLWNRFLMGTYTSGNAIGKDVHVISAADECIYTAYRPVQAMRWRRT